MYDIRVKFDLAIFDLDGTLCDTLADIAASVNRTLHKFNHATLPIEQVRGYVGRGARMLLQQCLAGTKVDVDLALKEFMKAYGEHPVDATRPYSGVEEGLALLAGVKKVIVSNKPESLSIEIVKRLGLSGHFLRIVGGDTFPTRKPDPAAVLETIRQFGATLESTLMVGDSDIDRDTAKAAGIKCCLVTYGYTDRRKLAGAEWIVDDFAAVVNVIRGILS